MEEGLTFKDVLLIPQRSSVRSRKDVDMTGRLSRNIILKCPIVSANMDTVTESQMAIALAHLGGLGIVHRFLSIEDEVAEVAKVKRAESIIIEEPYTLRPEDTVAEARQAMQRYGVGGLLVVSPKKKLIGIVTERDLLFHSNGNSRLREVMTKELVTARTGVKLEEAHKILAKHKLEKLPIVDEDGTLRGLLTAKDLQKKKLHPDASLDKKGRLLVGAAVGVVGDYLERSSALLEAGTDVLVVDVAHGHADHVIKAVEAIKSKWGSAEVVAGNVATYEGARDLALAGADAVKVGVGPGSTCSTRLVSGAGVPQLSAILDCAKITKENKVPIIADGGIRDSGDISKALAAGASSVMIGGLLAGTEESPGWTAMRGAVKYKIFRGMASLGAALTRRRSSSEEPDIQQEDVEDVVPEGVETMVPYRGKAAEVLHQLQGGLRSGMSYCGARNLEELWRKAKFVKMTSAGWQESKPHAVE